MITAANSPLRASRWTNCGRGISGLERCSNTEGGSSAHAQVELKLDVHAVRVDLQERGDPPPDDYFLFFDSSSR